MAIKKSKLRSSKLDLNDDLDFPEFDFDSPEIKDDRKPVSKILGSVRTGFTDSFTDKERVVKKFVSKALPDGYGDAMDLADSTIGGVKELYDTAAKEIKPGLKDMAKSIDKLVPESAGRTKKLLDRIGKWAEGDNYPKAPNTKDSENDYTIASSIASIFKENAKEEVKRNAEEDNRSRVKEGIDLIRHRDQVGLLGGIHKGISQLAQYQDRITSAYQKKSLELQYRSYFKQSELLDETKLLNETIRTQLSAITKNTGLPDYAKQLTTEQFSQISKNKFLNTAIDTLYGNNSEFVNKIKSRLKTTIKGYAEDAANAFSMASMGGDMIGMDKEFSGKSTSESFGTMAGGIAGDWAQEHVFGKIKGKLDKNDKLRHRGKKLAYGVRNLPQMAGELARKNRSEGGIKGFLASLFHDAASGAGPENKLETSNLNNLGAPTTYNQHANKSITEIIPGYLARIYRELQVTRTGKTDIGLTTYDYNKNTFSIGAATKSSNIEKLISTSSREQTKNNLDSIFSEIDPQGKLSPEARIALGKQLLKDRINNREGSAERYSDTGNMIGKDIAPHADEIASVFKSHFGNSDTEAYTDKNARFNRRFMQAGGGIGDARATIQSMLNAGMSDFVKSTGLISDDGKSIDINRLIDLHVNNDLDPNNVTDSEKLIQGESNKKSKGRTTTNKTFNRTTNQFDFSEVTKSINAFHSEYTDNSLKLNSYLDKLVGTDKPQSTLDDTNSILLRIEQKLHSGVASNDGEGTTTNAAYNGPTTLAGMLYDRGKKYGGAAFRGAKRIHEAGLKSVRGAVNTTMGIGGNILGGTIAKVDNFLMTRKDVFFGKDKEPRLTAWKLKHGAYFDQATGKVIKRLGDIKGAVVDSAGELVIAADEVKDLWVRKGIGQKVIKLGQNLFSTALDTAANVNKIGSSILGAGKDMLTNAAGAIRNLLDGPGDVYITGEKEPVLLGRIMRAGGYISQLTGKLIERMSDIDGPIVDKEGNVILTTDLLKKGIVDKYGNKIRSLWGKIGNAAGAMIGKVAAGAIKLGKGVLGGINKTVGAIGGGINNFLGGLSGGLDFGKWSKRNNSILESIYKLLNDRMPGKKSVLGDTDGDGLREGSWQDNLKSGKKEKSTATGEKKTTESRYKAGDILGGIGDKFKSAKDGIMSLLGLGGEAGAAKGAGSLLGKAGGGILRGAGALGRGALALGGLGLSGIASAASAVGGAASAALPVLGSIAGGIGAVVTSPVFLGALAVGAVGYGAYKLYQSMNKSTDDPMIQYRLAQYGLTSKDEDIAQAVLQFETMMEAQVTYEEGKATLTEKGLDYDKIFKLFGFSQGDEKALNGWATWFQNRFKPVFLTHQTALNSVSSGAKLSTIDKLTASEKLQYINLTSLDENVYNETTSPFPKINSLRATASDVRSAFEKLKTILSKDAQKNPDKGVTKAAAVASATGALAASKSDTEGNAKIQEQKENSTFLGSITNSVKTFFTSAATAVSAGASFVGTKIAKFFGYGVDALEAVRFRTYGLKAMDRDKVNALRELEDIVGKGFIIDASNVPQWKGSIADVMERASIQFGINRRDDSAVQIWTNWFTQRFLPAYTTYRGYLYQTTGKLTQQAGQDVLKPEDMLSIAEKVSAVNVWGITYSPWIKYDLNTNSLGVNENLNELRGKVKATTLPEAKKTDSPTSSGAIGNTDTTNKGTLANAADKKIIWKAEGNNVPGYEDPKLGAGNSGMAKKDTASVGTIARASGEIKDGSAADKFLVLRNAKMDGLHPDVKRLFLGMVQEYGELTGKTVGVNQAYRSLQDQEALYKADPKKAAKPGTSLHETGLALDVDSVTLNEMDKLGLMRKYGFTRPVGNEPWHLEPAGIQTDISKYRKDPNQAAQAIAAGVGRGGGGWGTIEGKSGHGRNTDMANAILASNTPVKNNDGTTNTMLPSRPDDKQQTASSKADSSETPDTSYHPATLGGMMRTSYTPSQSNANLITPQDPSIKSSSNKTTGSDIVGSSGIYDKLPNVQGNKGWNSVKDMLLGAAKAVGIDPKILTSVTAMESGFDTNAKAATSASGLGQILKDTWNELLNKYGSKFGIPKNASPFDPKANILLTGQYLKDNAKTISNLGREPTGVDLYLAHLLGPTGASKFLKSDGSAIAADVVPNAAKSNPDIFYNNGKPRTVSEVYSFLQTRLNSKLAEHGVDKSYMDGGNSIQSNPSSGFMLASATKPSTSSSTGVTEAYRPQQQVNIKPVMTSTEPMRSVASGGGDSSYRAVQDTKYDLNTSVGGIQTTLDKQLTVQEQMRDILSTMLNVMKGNASDALNTPKDSPKENPKAAETLPRVPVPMTRV